MDEATEQQQQFVWQPLTPKGVASFAHAPLSRLLLVQFLVALVAAGAVMWALSSTWFPVIREAIGKLPPEGEIRSGVLGWNGDSPQKLAGTSFLSIAIDMDQEGTARSPAHVNVEFTRRALRVYSLLGYWETGYSRFVIIAFNRTELDPWWGAWSPALLALVGAMVIFALMTTWAVLAAVYCVIPWIGGYFLNRDLPIQASWRLSGAALLPGALFLSIGIVCYGLGFFDLLRLGVAVGIHFVIAWIYLILAPFRAPYLPGADPVKGNPFVPEPAKSSDAEAE
jgi:hypothetical protein